MTTFSYLRALPNLITVARLILVPLVILLIINEQWTAAFLVFVVAGVSDAVDGFLAKRFGLETELGAYLDPVADKALLVSIFIALTLVHALPSALTILVVTRDVLIVGAFMISRLLDRPMQVRPLSVSKLNTTAQIVLAAGTLGANAFHLDLGPLMTLAVAIVVALTLGSAAAYLKQWLGHMLA